MITNYIVMELELQEVIVSTELRYREWNYGNNIILFLELGGLDYRTIKDKICLMPFAHSKIQ